MQNLMWRLFLKSTATIFTLTSLKGELFDRNLRMKVPYIEELGILIKHFYLYQLIEWTYISYIHKFLYEWTKQLSLFLIQFWVIFFFSFSGIHFFFSMKQQFLVSKVLWKKIVCVHIYSIFYCNSWLYQNKIK